MKASRRRLKRAPVGNGRRSSGAERPRVSLIAYLPFISILGVLLIGSSSPAPAATFTVNSNLDVVDAVPGDAACVAGPPAAGLCTLRAAIQEANALAGADTVDLPADTYLLTIPGASEDDAAEGDLDILADLTLTGAGAATTTVDGGALDRVLHVLSGVTATISDLTVRNGAAGGSTGGGIYNRGTLALSRVTVTANSAQEGAGIDNSADMSLVDVTISGNTAGGHAGGIRAEGGTNTLTGVTINGNSSNRGAGFWIKGAGTTGSLTNVTISGNNASDSGGGIHTERPITLTNVTITGNSAINGGAGINYGGGPAEATLVNTIVANSVGRPDCSTPVTSLGNNLDSDGSCGVEATGDPQLGGLQDNGGPTWTHALLTGSPALDSGTNSGCPSSDQRRMVRPANAVCDIGAFELDAFRGYVEKGESWTPGPTEAGIWVVKDLSVAPFNVPANAVVEIALVNIQPLASNWGGVRATGSSLERRFELMAPVSGGNHVVMHVQTDAWSRIEQYAGNTANVVFKLLGYWTEGRYQEGFDSFAILQAEEGLWVARDLAPYGVGPGEVAEMVLSNDHWLLARVAGVQSLGSFTDRGQERKLNVDDPGPTGGLNTATFWVEADDSAQARVEVFVSDYSDILFHVVGHWTSPPLTFVEKFVDLGDPTVSANWQQKGLGPSGVAADSVAAIMLSNVLNSGAQEMGVQALGSFPGASRRLDLMPGGTGGSGTFARTHANVDSSAAIEWYQEDIAQNLTFLLTGFWLEMALDGDVSEWANGSGNEICRDDEGGGDDWTNPSTADITKFCVSSNQSDTMYLLFGFDDVTLSGGNTATACVLMDTDAPDNGAADFLICVTLQGPGDASVQSVELYQCNDTSAEGCPNAQLTKSFTTDDYGFSRTQTGPFGNPDSFLELEVPWTDVDLSGGQVVFYNLISYPGKSFLTSPKDSILGLGVQTFDFVGYDLDTGRESTLVLISDFGASLESGGVAVTWETASEVGTLGFYLYRWEEASGTWSQVNEVLLPAVPGAPQGSTYRFLDEGAPAGGRLGYALVEVESSGVERTYGPFVVQPWSYRPRRADRGMRESFHAESRGTRHALAPSHRPSSGQRKKGTGAIRHGSSAESAVSRARADWPFRSVKTNPRGGHHGTLRDTALKIAVRETGLYRLEAAELAAAWGVSTGRVEGLIRSGRLSLRNRGREVAWEPVSMSQALAWRSALGEGRGPRVGTASAILFYGESIDSIYTRDNVYRLQVGRGVQMDSVDGRSLVGASGGSFRARTHFEEESFPVMIVPREPEEGFWYWGYVNAGHPRWGSSRLAIGVPGPAGRGRATLAVSLFGATETPATLDHHVEVRVNGVEVGESRFGGRRTHEVELEFPQSVLHDGENEVELRGILDSGAPYSVFYVDSLDLSYRRKYTAAADALEFRVGGHRSVSVTGFSRPDVRVYDISERLRPVVVEVGPATPGEGYEVRLAPRSRRARLLAVGPSAIRSPGRIWRDEPSALREAPGAEYLIVAAPSLVESARALASHRERYGLSTLVADLEDVYDEFAHGIAGPRAIRRFLRHAYRRWARTPRFVVLVGDGSLDYKDAWGYGDNLLPPLLTPTRDGIFASDTLMADVVGHDGVPEMAIGRIPAQSAAEVEAYVEKLEAYDGRFGHEGDRSVLLLADNSDNAGDFRADSEAIARLLRRRDKLERVYLSDLPAAEARASLFTALGDGVSFVNYIGHGGVDRLASEGLLTAADVPELVPGARLPVWASLTCSVGRFELPGFRSLAEMLVLTPERGAVAVWGPTGLSDNSQARILNQALVGMLSGRHRVPLGAAVRRALAAYAAGPHDPGLLATYNLIGDPAIEIR